MQDTKYTLRGSTGLLFVLGSGFTAASKDIASKLSSQLVEFAAALGFTGTAEEVPNVSFGVVYIRKGDATGVNLNKQVPNPNLGQTDPSKRRFATRDEAITHGSRFAVRRAKKTDAPGSAGHIGFFVVETNDPVNAAVNPATGLTNSL